MTPAIWKRGNRSALVDCAFGHLSLAMSGFETLAAGFPLKSLGALVLRFQRHDREYKTPLNFRLGGTEIPVGLALVTTFLFLVAIANLFTKKIATVYGLTFTAILLVLFMVSERLNARRLEKGKPLEEFNLDYHPEVSSTTAAAISARPGSVLVSVRDYSRLLHLEKVLQKTNMRRHDIVVMTVRPLGTGAGEYDLSHAQLFSEYERKLFTHVVTVAEKEGKHVELLVVPGVNPFDAMVQAAHNLKASRLVTGISARMQGEELARQIGQAWERLPEPRHPFSLEIIAPGRPSTYVNLGPHPPRLWPEDLDRLHDLWLGLSDDERFGSHLHHRDVIGVALRRIQRDLKGTEREEVVTDLVRELRTSHGDSPKPDDNADSNESEADAAEPVG